MCKVKYFVSLGLKQRHETYHISIVHGADINSTRLMPKRLKRRQFAKQKLQASHKKSFNWLHDQILLDCTRTYVRVLETGDFYCITGFFFRKTTSDFSKPFC